MTITPYLFFGGHTVDALAFYQEVFNGTIEAVMKYSDYPGPIPEGTLAPGFEDKVMHSAIRLGESMLYASDGSGPSSEMKGFMLHYPVQTNGEADRIFAALSVGGNVIMPLETTFWSPYYGMLEDKFGVGWMISIPQECSE